MAEKVASSKKALTDAAAANPDFAGKTAMVITPYEGLYVYGAQDPRVRLMNELGFVNPPGFDELFPADSDTFGGNISPEKAEILDVDTLVCFADEGEQQAQIETKLFKTQDVYTQGRTVWLRTADLGTLPFSFLTALSLPYLLEKFVPRVAAAVDGDPATSTEEAACRLRRRGLRSPYADDPTSHAHVARTTVRPHRPARTGRRSPRRAPTTPASSSAWWRACGRGGTR